jgi:hypothetical protein
MSHTEIRNKNCVALLDDNGICKAVARRVSTKHDWEIETYNSTPQQGVCTLVATVKSEKVPEVLQRKMVLAILKELA